MDSLNPPEKRDGLANGLSSEQELCGTDDLHQSPSPLPPLSIACFTDVGEALGLRLASRWPAGGQVTRIGSGELSVWTEECFSTSSPKAMVFIGSCGIAVRALAPFVQTKTQDPPCLVVDEPATTLFPCCPAISAAPMLSANQWQPFFKHNRLLPQPAKCGDSGLWIDGQWSKIWCSEIRRPSKASPPNF